MTARLIAVSIATALLIAGPVSAQESKEAPRVESEGKTGVCPSNRAHLEPKLKTRPDDGEHYTRTRRSVEMEIETVIGLMGGRERAQEIAALTRADAERRLAAGAKDAEKRYYEDSILRADALLAILDCLKTQTSI